MKDGTRNSWFLVPFFGLKQAQSHCRCYTTFSLMINKRRAIPLIVVIFLVCIVLALGLYHVFTSFDIKRSEDIVGAINVTTTGSSENIPLATEYNKLIILKKNWMTGRYSCWGTASTLSTVGTYQSVDSHNRIVVVYGNNSDICATSYMISNGDDTFMKNGLQDYILDIYIIQSDDSRAFTGELYKDDVVLQDIDAASR